ncbi:hypothetical protein FGK63_01955 [Ruegeria sediminis]|uniref:Lipoprotein n=1 Tax=Ruegeria sediminis TaxID=2583820 RepID=A0ABY2X3C9_9RHOB|nr:hypothetical protein [Ruegeria sediminis]TMV09858.1 hypothetical protein FGK63_01955 [Ruegeria sediminis]
MFDLAWSEVVPKSRYLVVMSVCLLGACQDPQQVASSAFDKSFFVGESYQAVYARTLQTMRLCLKPGTTYLAASGAGVTLDAQLYPDLGYAEIINGLSGVSPVTLGVTRIENSDGKTKVSIKAPYGIQSARDGYRSWLEYWSRGGTSCKSAEFQVAPTIQ